MEIFGATAKVYLKYDKGIDKLSIIIRDGLKLPYISIETDSEPPHHLFAYSESLGFELWLEENNEVKGYNFLLKIETELSVDEIFNDRLYNLSPWLAKYLHVICEIPTCIYNEKTKFHYMVEEGVLKIVEE